MPRKVNIIPMAGDGMRFRTKGYKVPKPLIPIDEKPMVVRAAECLPNADKWIFICKEEHIIDRSLEDILNVSFNNVQIITVNKTTEGQLSTVLLAKNYLNEDDHLNIGACDNRMEYSIQKFNIEFSKHDGLVWTFKNNDSVLLDPTMYGWVKAGRNDVAKEISCKVPISTEVLNDHAIAGAFSFKHAKDFLYASDKLIEKNRRINNEFYIDLVIDEAIKLNKNIGVFKIDKYISWGTPEDLVKYRMSL